MCVCACTACAPSSVRPCERASVAAGHVSGQLHPLRLARGPGDALALLRTHLHPSAPLTLCVFAPSPPARPTCCACLRPLPLHPLQITLELEREGQTINNKERLVRGQEFVSVSRRACIRPKAPSCPLPARCGAPRYQSPAQARHHSTPPRHPTHPAPALQAAPPHPFSSSAPPHPRPLSTRPTSSPRASARLAYAATTAPRAAARSAPCSAWARTPSFYGGRVRAWRNERRGGWRYGGRGRACA